MYCCEERRDAGNQVSKEVSLKAIILSQRTLIVNEKEVKIELDNIRRRKT